MIGSTKTRRVITRAAIASVASLTPIVVNAQTAATWINPIDGSWTETIKWSTHPLFPNNGTPAGTTYAVDFPGSASPYSVRLASTISVDSIALGSGAQLLLQNGTLQNANISGAGTFSTADFANG